MATNFGNAANKRERTEQEAKNSDLDERMLIKIRQRMQYRNYTQDETADID